MQIFTIVIASLAFALSCFLAFLEYQRRCVSLKACVTLKQIARQNNNMVLLIRVAFGNQASVGRTIWKIKYSCSDGLHNTLAAININSKEGNITLFSPETPQIGVTVDYRLEEMLVTPLDVLPNRSEVKLIPLVVSDFDIDKVAIPIEIELFFEDPAGKQICKCKADNLEDIFSKRLIR